LDKVNESLLKGRTVAAEFPESLKLRLESFRLRQKELLLPAYKEASVRVEYIDPLLIALGWDVGNSAGKPERFKDVVVEPSQEVDGHKRAPDYALRVGGERRLFVEAKKPSIYLKSETAASYQARRYAWSAQLPIVVLTNFRELAIYDGRYRPLQADPTRKARIRYYKLDELEANWSEIHALISREAVEAGSLESYTATSGAKGGSERIDRVFLKDLEEARQLLLAHVADKNPSLTDAELLRAIQLTLDRIIFLRICEDRLIEPYGALRNAAEQPDPRKALEALYRDADSRYNSGLFHFDDEPGRHSPDLLTPTLIIDPVILKATVLRFYPPSSPYAFGLMPVEVLGNAYESFLSQRITRVGGKVALELKPEVRKAGGVYYTPEWLTSRVLDMTLDPHLRDLDPDKPKLKSLRILDPACGSGSFLVQAYRHLLDWYLRQYVQDPEKAMARKPPRLERNKLNELALTLGERKRILLTHIFGVDIDEQAVEVAKLSLLLTLMEEQDATDVSLQLEVFKDRILPDLDLNIRCGNSLISTDILSDTDLADTHSPARARIRPFDWRAFDGEFAVIVGNPPWLMAGYDIEADALTYLKQHYDSYVGKADLYYLFIERSLGLLQDGGRMGLVVPNKMYSTASAKGLRKLLAEKPWVVGILDFQAAQLFEGATNYTQVLIASKRTNEGHVDYARATNRLALMQSWSVPRSQLRAEDWDLSSPRARNLWDKIRAGASPLRDIASGFGNGVQSGADKLLVLTREAVEGLKLEGAYVRPLVRGQDIRDGTLAQPEKFLIFPYKKMNDAFVVLNPSELTRAPWLEAYLRDREAALRKRQWFKQSAVDLTGQWWGLMYLDGPSAFEGTHLVTPSLSNRANFALGDGRLFPTGTAGVTSVELPASVDPRALLALLNSTLLSTFALAHSPVYQGGFHKFSKRYIDSIPIRPAVGEGVAVWARLADLWGTRASLAPGQDRDLVTIRINDLVNDFYGVTDAELKQVVGEVRSLTEDSLSIDDVEFDDDDDES